MYAVVDCAWWGMVCFSITEVRGDKYKLDLRDWKDSFPSSWFEREYIIDFTKEYTEDYQNPDEVAEFSRTLNKLATKGAFN